MAPAVDTISDIMLRHARILAQQALRLRARHMEPLFAPGHVAVDVHMASCVGELGTVATLDRDWRVGRRVRAFQLANGALAAEAVGVDVGDDDRLHGAVVAEGDLWNEEGTDHVRPFVCVGALDRAVLGWTQLTELLKCLKLISRFEAPLYSE